MGIEWYVQNSVGDVVILVVSVLFVVQFYREMKFGEKDET